MATKLPNQTGSNLVAAKCKSPCNRFIPRQTRMEHCELRNCGSPAGSLVRVELHQPIKKRSAVVDRLHPDALVQAMDVPEVGILEEA